jgi:tRNA A-37 threonylcarbamoyl transferase component Bud32
MGSEIISIDKLRLELKQFNIEASKSTAALDLGRLLESADEISIVKKNVRRQVLRIQAEGRCFFLKRSTLVRSKDRLRLLLLPNRRRAEWRNLHRLAAMGIPVPTPLVRGEARHLKPPQHFILTSEVAGRPVDYNGPTNWSQLGVFIGHLHGKGIYHADLHPGNMRMTADGEYALLDVQSVFFMLRLPLFLRLRNIGRFFFHFLESGDISLRLEPFLKGYNVDFTTRIGIGEALEAARGQLERHYRSRTRRCLANGSEFERVNDRGLKGYRRRGFDWERTKLQTAVTKGQALKSDTVLSYQGVCIKRRRKRWFHRDRCRTSWVMSRAMEIRGIEVPKSLAYLVSGHETYFLSEYIAGAQLLNDFLTGLSSTGQKRQPLISLARWIRRIHSSRLRQRDFKSSNILYRDGSYYLLDMESVTARQPDDAQKIMNLAQLNASVSNRITLRDRLRFFYFYTVGESWPRDRRRTAYRRIWKISSGKNTAIYDLKLEELLKEGGIGKGR